jgi:cation diffusion facilitator CzcD-associated flavoprotein CzcO
MNSACEHVDVLIVGAGISGVGAAWHLKTQSPGTTFVALEAKETFGGTWVTHRYPGVRSDSDLYTFGYRFKPWTGAPIATAQEILNYMGEVIEDNGLAPHIRYRHRIDAADWNATDKRWHLRVRREGTGETLHFTAGFLFMCQGYYQHEQGYTPNWPGMERFEGRVVHPQAWPQDLAYEGKRVLVIGSGATAATLIPAMADKVAHITMLQRSPTYFRTARNAHDLADLLRTLDVDEAWIHEITRRKILFDQGEFARMAKAQPDAVKTLLLDNLRQVLGNSELVDQHFTPRYRPWQQRLAFVPNADLFNAMKSGKASVVTDVIDCFVPEGVKLKSGTVLAADIIVTATGFNLSAFGGIPFSVAGKPVDFSQTVAWRGAMFTGVPNLMWVFGYLRWSWTLRVDLLGDLLLRLLAHMKAQGATSVTPALRAEDTAMALLPWV